MKRFILFIFIIIISAVGFTQNTNPYEAFGYTSKVKYEIPISHLFRVNNSDTNSNIKAMAIDFDKSFAYLLGENDSLIRTIWIDNDKVLIWLSVDPLSDKYPSTSPYAYCRNNPIMRVDPDGRADDWVQPKEGGGIVYDSRVKDPETAKTYYGGDAKYKGASGYSYTGVNGNKVVLGKNGNYTSNGQAKSVPDLANSNKSGLIVSTSASFALLFGVGVEAGVAVDNSKVTPFFTVSRILGVEAGGGINIYRTTNTDISTTTTPSIHFGLGPLSYDIAMPKTQSLGLGYGKGINFGASVRVNNSIALDSQYYIEAGNYYSTYGHPKR